MRPLLLTLTAAAITCLAASAVEAQSLGASFDTIHRAYTQAKPTRIGTAQALELTQVDYAGVRWKSVDFIFDAQGRLSRMAMTTASAPYATVMQLAQLQLKAPQPADGLAASSEEASPEMQLRVCERDDGEVTLTYESLATLS